MSRHLVEIVPLDFSVDVIELVWELDENDDPVLVENVVETISIPDHTLTITRVD